MQTLLAMIRKEFLQLKEDKRLLAISLVAPVIMVTLFSYAANIDVNNIKVAFVDPDNSSITREIRDKFSQSGYFTVTEVGKDAREADYWLDAGKARVVVVFPEDFSAKIQQRISAPVQLLIDGADGNTASIATAYSMGILNTYNQQIITEIMNTLPVKPKLASVSAETRIWYNPDLKTMNFMVPGILCLVLLISTMITTSMSIVKEKELGTLEQLIVTPIKPWQIIGGKLLPFSITATIVVILLLGVNSVLMEVPLRGNVFALIFLIYIYLITTLGLGLFISTVSNTQQQAALTAIFMIMPPMIFFSGFIFPVENMPMIIQWISVIIPLKYMLVMVRGIFLKGIGLELMWQEALILFGFSVLILWGAIMRFSKKLE